MNNIPNITFEEPKGNTDFELIDLSELFGRLDQIENHNPTLPHRISFFALLLVTQGTGTHQIDLKEYELSKGTVLRIAKGQVHSFQKKPKYKGFLMVFTEEYVLNYFSKSSINLISHFYNYHVSSPLSNNLVETTTFLHQINEELGSINRFAQNNIISAYLELFLLRLERLSSTGQFASSNSNQYSTFLQFKNLVERSFKQTRNVKDYAVQLLISTKHLNQVVKKFTLNTAKKFIDDFVFLEAKREIVSTNKSFKEIAFDIGFDEVTNFTKFFKKNLNSTPKEFRLKQIS